MEGVFVVDFWVRGCDAVGNFGWRCVHWELFLGYVGGVRGQKECRKSERKRERERGRGRE